MNRSQKRALRFAYDLLRGRYDDAYLPYLHHVVPKDSRIFFTGQKRFWIEPDRDPQRPYLNEAAFSALNLAGYMECTHFEEKSLWLYRLSRAGCIRLGWEWPLAPVFTILPGIKPNRRLTQHLHPFQRNGYDEHNKHRSRHDLYGDKIPLRTNAWRRR